MGYRISGGVHLEQSRQQREFLHLPVQPHTVLFINVTRNATSGDLRSLLNYCLSCEELSDYTFFWDVAALHDLTGIPDACIEENRVHVVAHDAYEYRQALAVCEYILTADPLPYQYVKRPGQHIVYLPNAGIYWARALAARRFLQGALPLLDAADLLVVPNQAMLDALLPHRSPACLAPLATLVTPHPRGSQTSTQADGFHCKVVVSLTKKLFNRFWGNTPDRLFDWARRVALAWKIDPQEICLMVPGQAMDWIYDGYVRTPIKLVTFAEGLYAQLEGASVLLTNNAYDLGVGLARGITCVFARSDTNDFDVLATYEPFDRPCYHVSTIAEGADLITSLLSEGAVDSMQQAGDSSGSCKAIINAMLTGAGTKPYVSTGNRDLLIAPWTDASGFRDFQRTQGLKGIAGTLLLMGDEKYRILEEEREEYSNACLTYRAGFHSGDDEERELILQNKGDELYNLIKDDSENFMILEWLRMLGPVRFSRILAPEEGLNCFWETMLRFAPADSIERYESFGSLEGNR